MSIETISIQGARVNNLKNISVDIPRNKLTVVTGVSGSGKSSLVFDLIYAEGLNRLLDCFPVSANRFLPQLSKPNVDNIFGLSPVFAISQRRSNVSPRSTVGTITELYNYIRNVFSVMGIPHCPYCGKKLTVIPFSHIAENLKKLPQGQMVEILAPIEKIYGENYNYLFNILQKRGYSRFYINEEYYNSNDEIELNESLEYQIEVIIDSVYITPDIYLQLIHSVEHAAEIGEGFVRIRTGSSILSDDVSNIFDCGCEEHHMFICELSPKYFVFNDEQHACRTCKGVGVYPRVNSKLIITDKTKSLGDGAIHILSQLIKYDKFKHCLFASLLNHFGYNMKTPYKDLSEQVKKAVLYGMDDIKFELLNMDNMNGRGQYITYEGLIPEMENRYKKSQMHGAVPTVMDKRIFLNYMVDKKCPECHGKRLRQKRLLVTLNDKNIYEVSEMPICELKTFIYEITPHKDKHNNLIQIVDELKSRLSLLDEIGLGYMSMNRRTNSLSGGEYQRLKLCTQLRSKLVGMLYIIDEPSIGLHERDTNKVVDILKQLRDIDNTVIVVEHDLNTIREADHIIEIGPGAGADGGEVIAQGDLFQIQKEPRSLTGKYLTGILKTELPQNRKQGNGKLLTIYGAKANNLRNIDVNIPLGLLVCVTGVSGSGKSTLISEILYKKLASIYHSSLELPGEHDHIDGIENIKDVIIVDQTQIGRHRNSNPATYIGFYDQIRSLFAKAEEAVKNGLTASYFSFNIEGGRCEGCKGYGYVSSNLQFIPDSEVVCPECNGNRFSREALSIKYKNKSIIEVLNMSVTEGIEFFKDNKYIYSRLTILDELGLGYMIIGQSANTLSGGESQRIKLATELVKKGNKKDLLYILDEPTTGLHPHDISKLLKCIDKLIKYGNTVVVVEHNMDVIKVSDYIIDLGPDAGNYGGYLIASGTPEEISMVEQSYTGQILKKYLKNS